MAAPLTTPVLLVDDRPENLLALEAALAPLSCELVRARSGEEALKALLQRDFAVIVLDVQMPVLDGFETAELIRARERTRVVPIIFVTAISKEAHHVFRGYSAGAVDYVVKPFDPAILLAKVRVFVELHERAVAIAAREELLRAMFEDAPVGIARSDADGRLLHVNAALCATLGRDQAELVGRSLDELAPPQDAGVDAAQRADLLAGRVDSYEVERRLAGPGGSSVPVLVAVSCTRSRETPEPELVIHVLDLTDRRRAESRREQLVRAQAARAEAEATAERLRVSEAIAGAALGAETLDELLGELLGHLVEALGIDSAGLALLHRDDQRVLTRVAGATSPPGWEPAADPVLERVARERAPVVLPDAAAAGVRASSLGAEIRSILAVPLGAEGEVVGSLQIGTIEQRAFDAEAIELLMLAADRAALAIARAQLREHERDTARRLQRSLLPRALPAMPGTAMAARYEPGARGDEVGGDWYDAVALPGGRVALAIGDVVGRGIDAAVTMGQMRSALRASIMHDDDTGVVVDRLNRFALSLPGAMMTTVVVGVLEPATGRLRYTNAGHPPALVLDPAAGPSFVQSAASPPLGVLDTPRYVEHELTLAAGASLLLYTDGLVERPGEVLDAGLERLVAACAGAEADVEALGDRALGSAGVASDDVTLLVVRMAERLGDPLTLDVTGDRRALTATRDAVRRWLAEAGADDRAVYDVTMACNEACQNAIEHAYEMGGGHVALVLEHSDADTIAVTVADRGRWRDGTTPDRGRGLELMRSLMDDVDLRHDPVGTTVVMRHHVAPAAAVGRPPAAQPSRRH